MEQERNPLAELIVTLVRSGHEDLAQAVYIRVKTRPSPAPNPARVPTSEAQP